MSEDNNLERIPGRDLARSSNNITQPASQPPIRGKKQPPWKIILALLGPSLFWLASFAFQEYLQERGFVSMEVARIFLVVAWVASAILIVIMVMAFDIEHKGLSIIGGLFILTIMLGGLETLASRRKSNEEVKPQPPPNLPVQQPPVVREPPTAPPILTPEPPKTIPAPTHKAPNPQPQEPAAPTVAPNPNCRGVGPDPYKDCSDDQVGEWAIEEADKIEQKAKEHLIPFHDEMEKRAQFWQFSSDFKVCCAQAVKDLRTEILGRLGPPAIDSDEEEEFSAVFRGLPPPIGPPPFPHPVEFNPFAVLNYAPYLRRLGLKLKARGIPKIGPMTLNFLEAPIASKGVPRL